MRLSYSIYNAWRKGDRDNAIRMMLHLPIEVSPYVQGAMDRGSDVHKRIEITKDILLPSFQSPSDIYEYRFDDVDNGGLLVGQVDGEDIRMVGVADILNAETHTVIDWKCPIKIKSASTFNVEQLYMMGLLASYVGIEIQRGIIATIDISGGSIVVNDYLIACISPAIIEETKEKLLQVAFEIKEAKILDKVDDSIL